MPKIESRNLGGDDRPGVSLAEVVAYSEELLSHATVADWPNALNGLHIQNSGQITKIGAAVDACEATLAMAAARGIDFMVVHHGLFWSGVQRVKGATYRKLKLALEADLAVFSSHLPLDLHPELGNNACLVAALGLEGAEPFFQEKGALLGLKGRFDGGREALREKLSAVLQGGAVHLIPGGGEAAGMVGVVTGGAGSEVFKAAGEGVDTFISGEAPHWAYTAAEELGLNVLLGGHYATETFGVKALAAHLSERYGLPWEFLDHPTGL